MDTCNVIATKWLAKRCLEHQMALSSGGNTVQPTEPEDGSAVQAIIRLRATIETRVPVGYENETGFHYGVDVTD